VARKCGHRFGCIHAVGVPELRACTCGHPAAQQGRQRGPLRPARPQPPRGPLDACRVAGQLGREDRLDMDGLRRLVGPTAARTWPRCRRGRAATSKSATTCGSGGPPGQRGRRPPVRRWYNPSRPSVSWTQRSTTRRPHGGRAGADRRPARQGRQAQQGQDPAGGCGHRRGPQQQANAEDHLKAEAPGATIAPLAADCARPRRAAG
jgi:hypothetical protein